MTRRDLLRKSAMAPAAFLPQAARRTSRPNILLLMADQWRADCLGSAGNRVIHTPNLDQLAAGGVRFTNAYSSTPTCTPARAGLLTGLAPWNHGMLRYAEVGSRYPLEMPRALRDAGYYTAAIGKLHYHPQRNLHGYHQALLDESGRIESTDFRSDYRSWFWSQAPNLDPDATGLGWNDFDAEVYGSRWSTLRLVTAGEDHPQGKKLLCCRLQARWSLQARVIFWSLCAAELLVLGLLGSSVKWLWFLLLSLPALAWFFERDKRNLQSVITVFLDDLATDLKLIKVNRETIQQPLTTAPPTDQNSPFRQAKRTI